MRQISTRVTSVLRNTFIHLAGLLFCLGTLPVIKAQLARDSCSTYISIETDPAFWIGTLPNGAGFDANIDVKLKPLPNWRLGVLLYRGAWSGAFGKQLLLNETDFFETDWNILWSGGGIELQRPFKMNLKRGGLQPGLRLQWNQFIYRQNNIRKGDANHFVLTPQIGFQWFPFKKYGLYLLPWAGIQLPMAGTDKRIINETNRHTRKAMPVVTVHLGWEFKLK